MSMINLLPDDYILARQQRRANVFLLVLLAVVMTFVLGATIHSQQSTARTAQVRQRVDEAYDEAARMLAQMQELQAHKSRMLNKAEQTAGLMERVPRSYILATLTNCLPPHSSLTKMDMNIIRVVAPVPVSKERAASAKFQALSAERTAQVSAPVIMIEVTGLAGTDVDVAKYIANLARNPIMQSVDLVYSEQKNYQDVPIREFRVKMAIRPGADAQNAIKAPSDETDQASAGADEGAKS